MKVNGHALRRDGGGTHGIAKGVWIFDGETPVTLDAAKSALVRLESGGDVDLRQGSAAGQFYLRVDGPAHNAVVRESLIARLWNAVGKVSRVADDQHWQMRFGAYRRRTRSTTPCLDVHTVSADSEAEAVAVIGVLRELTGELIAVGANATHPRMEMQFPLSSAGDGRIGARLFAATDSEYLERLDQEILFLHPGNGLSDLDVGPPELGWTSGEKFPIEVRFFDSQSQGPLVAAHALLIQAALSHARNIVRSEQDVEFSSQERIAVVRAASAYRGGSAVLFPPSNSTPAKFDHIDRAMIAAEALDGLLTHSLMRGLRTVGATWQELSPIWGGARLRSHGITAAMNQAEAHLLNDTSFGSVRSEQSGQSASSTSDIELIAGETHASEQDVDPIVELLASLEREVRLALNDEEDSVTSTPVVHLEAIVPDAATAMTDAAIGQAVEEILVARSEELDVDAQFVKDDWTIRVLDITSIEPGDLPQADAFYLDTSVVVNSERRPCSYFGCNETGLAPCPGCPTTESYLCANHQHRIDAVSAISCEAHAPVCETSVGCTTSATTRCRQCLKLFCERHRRDSGEYCSTCLPSNQCDVCERPSAAGAFCQYRLHEGAAVHGVALCWEHSWQWQVWGPKNRGVTMCAKHMAQLEETHPRDLLTMILLSPAPFDPKTGKMVRAPSAWRCRRFVSRTTRQTLGMEVLFDLAEGLNGLAPHLAQRDGRLLGDRLKSVLTSSSESLEAERRFEGEFRDALQDLNIPSSALHSVVVRDQWRDSSGTSRTGLLVGMDGDWIGHLVGRGGVTIRRISDTIGVETISVCKTASSSVWLIHEREKPATSSLHPESVTS